MITIKQLSKSEKEEGLTLEAVNDKSFLKSYSPVVLLPGDEPVKLMECSAGFWVLLNDDTFLKDKKGMYVVPFKEAQIGRARYLLNFKSEVEAQARIIFEKEIQEEILRLKAKVDVRLKDDIGKIREILVLGGKIEVTGIEAILMHEIEKQLESPMDTDPFNFNNYDKVALQNKKEAAKKLATDELLQAYHTLIRLSELGKYNDLYQYYFQDGLPLLASYNTTNSGDVKAMVKSFHHDKIMDTIDQIKTKDHLYMVAKFNVEKRG